MMNRGALNGRLLSTCVQRLRSRAYDEVCEGAVLAAYIIEQTMKSELKAVNALLYFDRKRLSAELEARIGAGVATPEETIELRTVGARRCIDQVCEIKPDLLSEKATLTELFRVRNQILHSTDDMRLDIHTIAESAASALRGCRTYIAKYSEALSDGLTPLTSREFEALQEEEEQARVDSLNALLEKHRAIFAGLSSDEAAARMTLREPKTDSQTWIDNTSECPACHQSSFDCISSVDFEEGDEGEIVSYGGSHYECRICELQLTGHEANLAKDEQ